MPTKQTHPKAQSSLFAQGGSVSVGIEHAGRSRARPERRMASRGAVGAQAGSTREEKDKRAEARCFTVNHFTSPTPVVIDSTPFIVFSERTL